MIQVLIEVLLPKHRDGELGRKIKETNEALEELRREHRQATSRTERAMAESVRIAQDALQEKADKRSP
jgi:hypothetical protein